MKWRIFYCILSLLTSFFITFHSVELIFLYEAYPFIKFIHKKFIATHVMELFNSAFQISFFIVYINIFPLIFYHILSFFSNSWFIYQVYLFKIYFYLYYFIILAAFIFTNSNFLPRTFEFFTQWELRQENSLLQLKMDARIYSYLTWIMEIHNFINFFLFFLIVLFFVITLYTSPIQSYKFVKDFKKQVWFTLIVITFIFSTGDVFTQIILILLNILLAEVLFFVTCFRFTQFKFLVAQLG
uniref:Sec-independent protein translocase n=1 Tax=Kumanoa mahlacensis TaxID=1196387 RepID=A0A343UXW9_9FLOR|nr:Sec-independent protein translocase [Kumanoa mahlacensis]AVK39526.1 Sec-independent protein translocase [Kumanoa mahlacensis]UEQ11868.1 Sec-independent protein translocase [Kumanoa mahlacensis]